MIASGLYWQRLPIFAKDYGSGTAPSRFSATPSRVLAASMSFLANWASVFSSSAAMSCPAWVRALTWSSRAAIRRSASASSSSTAIPAMTVRRLSPISPTAPLSPSTWVLNRSARPIRCPCWPSSQAMRYLRPLISTLTSGTSALRLLQNGADILHRLDQPARHFMRAIIEPLGAGRGLVEFGGEPGPLMHQALGIHLHALLALHAAGQLARAGFEPRPRPVEPRRGCHQPLFKFCLTHGRYRPQDASIPAATACPSPQSIATASRGKPPEIRQRPNAKPGWRH